MRELNFLFLGGGKRVSLMQRFILAADKLKLKANLYSYDKELNQPVSSLAKVIKGSELENPRCESEVEKIIIERKIDLIISNIDPATLIHSRLARKFDAASFCSSVETALFCLSKKEFQTTCESNGLNVIPLATSGLFPCFAKPDKGSSSIGAQTISSQRELEELSDRDNYIFQKYIEGTEISVDAYISRVGEICAISPRERHKTLGGESVVTKTFDDLEIRESSCEIIRKLNLIGPITIQFIREHSTKNLYLLEVNPRFGGGVIASIEAGFDIPMMMIQERLGMNPIKIRKGRTLVMKRYFAEVFFETDN